MIVDEYKFFQGAVLTICRNLDLETALQESLAYLKNYMPVDTIEFNFYDHGLEAIRNLATATEEKTTRRAGIIPLDDAARKQIQMMEAQSACIVDPHEKKDPIASIYRRVQKMWPEFSVMVMHLAVKGLRTGSLVLFAEGRRRYTEEHRILLEFLKAPFTIALSNIMQYNELHRLKDEMADDLQYLSEKLRQVTHENIVGESLGLKDVMEMVREVSPLDSPVLLMGETGTGKEIIATAVHTLSPRKKGPFIKVNCGAIPETLIDSELFGHEKGAFTGAASQKKGCFERAIGGTIFLDEIAELPLQAQIRMLRVLQEKKIVRVGGGEEIDVDIRIIAATHQNLVDMVAQKRFRADLHYRLNVFPILIPPLRDRKEDIPALTNYFIAKKSQEMKIFEPPRVAPGAIDALYAYDWPGNVRELQNVVERALILNKKGPLTFNEIVWTEKSRVGGMSASGREVFPTLDFINARHIREALKVTKGRVNGPNGAAALLGINPNTLRHRMKKLGLHYRKKTSSGRSHENLFA